MFIHPKAEVLSKKIGSKTKIWQYAVVLEGAQIGENCNINCHTFIENEVMIGNNVTIKSGVYLWDGIGVEDDVFIGPNVTFINDRYPRSKRYLDKYPATIIKSGASIGANSTIMEGVNVGRFSLIGAASLVLEDVADFTLWYGSPAKCLGYVTRMGITLSRDLKDKLGNQYSLNETGEPLRNE